MQPIYQMSEKVIYNILLFYRPFGQVTGHIYWPEVKITGIGWRAGANFHPCFSSFFTENSVIISKCTRFIEQRTDCRVVS